MNYLKKFWKIYKAQLVIAACCAAFVTLSMASPRDRTLHAPPGLEKIASLGAVTPDHTPQSDRPGETSPWVDLFSLGAVGGIIKFRQQMKDVTAVAAGKTAVISMPTGWRYHNVILTLGDSAAGNGNAPAIGATANEIRVLIGGKTIRRYTPTELDIINTAMGATYASQSAISGGANGTGRRTLPIYFSEPWRKRVQDQDALAIQTGWLGTNGRFQVEVDLKTGITPVLTACAEFDNFYSRNGPNRIMKWLPNDFNAAATPLEIATLERKEAWSQLSFFDTSDAKTVDRVRLVVAGQELHDLTSAENTTLLKMADMNPATGAYHVVFDNDDSLDDVIPFNGTESVHATLTLSAAPTGTLRCITQRIGLPTD